MSSGAKQSVFHVSVCVCVCLFVFLYDRYKGEAGTVCFPIAIPQKEVFITVPQGAESSYNDFQ